MGVKFSNMESELGSYPKGCPSTQLCTAEPVQIDHSIIGDLKLAQELIRACVSFTIIPE